MRILAVTNDWPTAAFPACGSHMRQLLAGLEESGINVDLLHLDRRSCGIRVYMQAAESIRDKMRHDSYDLVHATYGGIMAERITSALSTHPVIVSFCGSDLLGENCAGRLRRLISHCGVIASHRAARLATSVIVQSPNLEHALPKDIDRRKVKIISNGVDMDRFRPMCRDTCCDRLGWEQEPLHILFPANGGDPVKRPALARQAVCQLTSNGIRSELHLLQGVRHEEVPLWMNGCDVVLLTSQHEGSPNIVKEALACNKPVVSVDVGDVASRISTIKGCYMAAGDPLDLASKLQLVYHGPRRVSGREKISDLSLGKVSRRIVEFYHKTLSRFRSQRNASGEQRAGYAARRC